ncbi:DUF6890 family protein [Nitratidesulfovibrio vulgaris]
MALSRRWFPTRAVDTESMAEALWLERRHWENMGAAVASGIVKAFKG